MLPHALPSNEASLAHWLRQREPAMHRVILAVLRMMALPAPRYIRLVLLADTGLHEDIIADAKVAYLSLFRRSRVEDGREGALLNAVAANITRTRARQEAAHKLKLALSEGHNPAEQVADPAPLPDELVALAEDRLALRRKLDLLPDRDRRALATYLSEGHEGVVRDLGVGRDHARLLVHRALKKLRELMTKRAR